jgi:DnaJ-class molecular chaperone
MICPDCHGNGYWIEQMRVLRQVRQCETCNSQGEVDYIYEKSCDDSDCLCRKDVSWPDNIENGCSEREGVERCEN